MHDFLGAFSEAPLLGVRQLTSLIVVSSKCSIKDKVLMMFLSRKSTNFFFLLSSLIYVLLISAAPIVSIIKRHNFTKFIVSYWAVNKVG